MDVKLITDNEFTFYKTFSDPGTDISDEQAGEITNSKTPTQN